MAPTSAEPPLAPLLSDLVSALHTRLKDDLQWLLAAQFQLPISGEQIANAMQAACYDPERLVQRLPTIRALARNAEVNSRITSIYAEWDPIIPNGSFLEGATNLELPSRGHFRLLDRPDLLDAVARSVDGA